MKAAQDMMGQARGQVSCVAACLRIRGQDAGWRRKAEEAQQVATVSCPLHADPTDPGALLGARTCRGPHGQQTLLLSMQVSGPATCCTHPLHFLSPQLFLTSKTQVLAGSRGRSSQRNLQNTSRAGERTQAGSAACLTWISKCVYVRQSASGRLSVAPRT